MHATGYPVYAHAQQYIGRPFTDAQHRKLYAEWLQVGRILGINDRDMPATVEEFWPYYRKVLADEIRTNVVVEELVATDRPVPAPDRGPLLLRLLLRALWPVLLPPLARFRRFVTIGFMPPDAREAIGLDWTDEQERRCAASAGWCARSCRCCPSGCAICRSPAGRARSSGARRRSHAARS